MSKIKVPSRVFPAASLNEQRIVIRCVLRMTDKYLAKQKQDLLVTDGRGLMTWGEIRRHIRAAINSDLLRKPMRADAGGQD